jgi:hypothetical protein
MADDDAIQRKRERLTVEMHEYFWNVCPELIARWKEASGSAHLQDRVL